MKTRVLTTFGLFSALAVASAQTIPNPSFEANSFTVWPGYVSDNGAIDGWVASGGTGLNPASGSPFADNGAVPDGYNVAFIQSGTDSSLSTVISNLTVGETYKVNFRVNARSYLGTTPNLKVDVAGTTVINTTVAAVGSAGSSNPYQYFAFDFTAAASTQTLTLRNDAINSDNTVLVDDFSIAARESGWSYAAWNDDTTSGVVATNNYTHAYHFGSSTGTNINGVTFTGIAGGNPSAGGSFSTAGLPNLVNNDFNNVTGASRQLAYDFLWGGAVQSITINGLVVGKSYVATIYSVGWDINGARAATFSVGDDRLTVNQDQFGNDNGIRVSYYYTAGSSRSITLTYVPLQGGGQTFHTYGFSNYELPTPNFHAEFLIVTNLADSGPGTLRQAIADAESGDTITFAANGTIRLASSPLFIPTSLNIAGPGPASLAVDGNLAHRVFELESGLAANISGLTIQNGRYPNGGGLGNFGTMVLSNCVITGNAAGASGFGGAIHNGTLGVLSLIACTVSNNRAGEGGGGPNGANGSGSANNGSRGSAGGPGGNGGGIYNEGALAMTACTINNNAAGNGGSGGVGGNGSLYLVVSCGNGGDGGAGGNGGSGGGVYNGFAGTLALTNCTIFGNAAGNGGSGGGGGNPSKGFCTYGNAANGGKGLDGGGIYNAVSARGLALTACTLGNNRAGDGGAGGSGSGGILGQGSGDGGDGGNGGGIFDDTLSGVLTELRNTLVAQNQAGRSGGHDFFGNPLPPGVGVDLRGGHFVSHGNNLVGNNDGVFTLVNQSSTDIVGTNAMLAPLGDNGGPTLTVALLPGSPGINAGDDTLTSTLATDQRGAPRKVGPHVDIGAFEVQLPVVLNANDSGAGSLRNVVLYSSPLQTITFDTSLSAQTIHLTTGQLTVSKSLTMDASALAGGVAIDSGVNFRVLEITAGNTVTVDSLTVINGRSNFGGGILVDGGATLTVTRCRVSGNSANDGGGIANYGGLSLSNCTVAGNSATHCGGGIHNLNGGIVTVRNSTVSSNSASYGGGLLNKGMANMADSTLSGNWAANYSGGIDNNSGTVTLTNCNLVGNSAGFGGGIHNVNGGIATLDSSTFSDNRASNDGGGIHNESSGMVTLNSSTVSGNSASYGGGLLNNGMANMADSTLSGNWAANYSGGIDNNSGTITLTNCNLVGNSASFGGGIHNVNGGMATLDSSTVSGNRASNGGGGIHNEINGKVTLNNSTLSGNSATGNGGAIDNDAGAMLLLLNNCTFSGNSAGGGGGGIENYQATATLNNCTLSANSAGGGGGINNYGTLALTNAIVAGNTAPVVANLNLDSSGSFSGANNLTNGIPLLAPLGNYGGPTQTMPPLHGSLAIDGGLDSVIIFLGADQRGYPRWAGTHVDIGAAEAQRAPAANPLLTNPARGSDGAFGFSFTNVSVADFTVLCSSNVALPLGQWSILGAATRDAAGQHYFSDPEASNYPQRFYKVSSP